MDENNARDVLLFAIANSLDVLLGELSTKEAGQARAAMFQAASDLADAITLRTQRLAS
jgi:hypothetical protein